MPRNSKCRRVCAEFENTKFAPLETASMDYLTMNVEELEALRLCDLEGLEQEDAAKRMEISRGTLQRILYAARQKSAKALCEGMGVLIQGGNYEIATTPCEYSKLCKRCRLTNMSKENDENE